MPLHASFKQIVAFEVAWRLGKLLLAVTSKGFMSCNSKKCRHEKEGNFLIVWVAFLPSGHLTLVKYTLKEEVIYYSGVQPGPSAEDWHSVWVMSGDKSCKMPCWWWIEDQISRLTQCCSELCTEISFISSCSEPGLDQKMCLYLWKITQGAATVLIQFIFPLLSVEEKEMLYLEVDLSLSFDPHFKYRNKDKIGNCLSSEDFQNEAQNTLETI